MARPKKEAKATETVAEGIADALESQIEVAVEKAFAEALGAQETGTVTITLNDGKLDFTGVTVQEDDVSYTFKGERGDVSISKASGIAAIQAEIDRVK